MRNIPQSKTRQRYFGRIPRPLMRGIVLVVFIALATLVISRPVHADPHAIFYTAVGQQQLFFNVLAALDQADYVETEAQRLQLVDQRAAAAPQAVTPEGKIVPAFSAETYPGVTATEAEGYSAILTRLLTLEGNDLYTDFVTRSFALESTRRNGLEEVTNLYCQEALGWPNCREQNANDPTKRANQERAFVVDGVLNANKPYLRGAVGVLQAGTTNDQQTRNNIMTDARQSRTQLEEGYQYDSFVGSLTERSAGSPPLQLAVERVAGATEDALLPTRVDPDTFAGIVFDPANGDPLLATNDLDVYTAKLFSLAELPTAMLESAMAGMDRQLAAQQARTVAGSRADVELKAQDLSAAAGPGGPGALGTISEDISAPASVKVAGIGASAEGLLVAEATLEATGVDPNVIGETELVRRGAQVPPPPPSPSPPLQTPILVTTPLPGALAPPRSVVAGAQSRPQGQVAGIWTDFLGTLTHGFKTPYSARAIPANVHHEQGYQHLVRAFNMQSRGDGCGCGLAEMVGQFGGPILGAVGEPGT